jgi:hypothetical protein
MARNEALELLHTAVNHWAPNGVVQSAIVKVRRKMEEADESPKAVALELASILVDGLRYGNWPK